MREMSLWAAHADIGLGPVFRAKPRLGIHFWFAHGGDIRLGIKSKAHFLTPF